jgi:uncharacterized protein (TIGR03435 family)
MRKFLIPRIAAGLLLASATFGQTAGQAPTPAAKLAFEVATIKPAGPLDPAKVMSGQMRIGMNVDAARVDIGSLSLADLLGIAFRVKPNQIAGPDWMASERFSIQAKLPDGADKEQVPEMLQTLLVDRFKLAFHHDDKEQSVYALVVGKGGSKLKESPPDDPATASASGGAADGAITIGSGGGQVHVNGNPASNGGMVVQGGPTGPMRMAMGPNGTMRMESAKMTLATFAELLSRFVGAPVQDMTDLKGNYQIGIDLSMDDMRTAAASAGISIPGGGRGDAPRPTTPVAADPSGGTIFHSLQQLGLKLEQRKSPIGRIVIDHLERAPVEP